MLLQKFRYFAPEKIVWLHSKKEVSDFLQGFIGHTQEQYAADENRENQEQVLVELIFA